LEKDFFVEWYMHVHARGGTIIKAQVENKKAPIKREAHSSYTCTFLMNFSMHGFQGEGVKKLRDVARGNIVAVNYTMACMHGLGLSFWEHYLPI
jgi:hypothetical protein